MSLFLLTDYRKYLKEHISRLPKKGHGELSRMAKAINVHQTLMSMVIGGERDLSAEQCFDLSNYLGLTGQESEYFALMVQFARAGNKRYKDSVFEKMEKVKKEAQKISTRVQQDKVLSEQERAIAYSSWIYSAVRMFTSIGKGKTTEDIQNAFRISRRRAIEVLNFLESTGLVVKEKEFYKMGPQRTFLEQGSPHLLKHHTNWRVKAIDNADQMSEKELMFTSPVSLSVADFEKLREQMAVFIKNFLQTVQDSEAEGVACLNMDFFWLNRLDR